MLGQRALFSLHDAMAVRKLARRDTRLGKQVKAALDVIDEAIKRYGCVVAVYKLLCDFDRRLASLAGITITLY
jgi:hypothetical protein